MAMTDSPAVVEVLDTPAHAPSCCPACAAQLEELHHFVVDELRPLLTTFAGLGEAVSAGGIGALLGIFGKNKG